MDVYISCHYTTHGIAYLKHILSCFYKKNTTDPGVLERKEYDQNSCNNIFDNNNGNKVFDKVFYLTVNQEAINKVTSRRYDYNSSFEKDEVLKEKGLIDLYRKIRANKDISYDVDKELQFVKENFDHQFNDFKEYMWHDIHHYEISEQIKWLKEQSNFFKVYDEKKFQEFKLEIKDLRDEQKIAEEIRKFFSSEIKRDYNCVIDISLCGPEVQSVWHILASNNLLPPKTKFIKTYDKKERIDKHFKPFTIKTVSTKLIDDITLELFPHTKSKKRELVNIKIEKFLNSGFSVLILGQRGTGKSSAIRNIAESLKKKENELLKGKLVEASCASFTNSDIAESELFGYVKGAFTGAIKDRDGLIKEAESGILFLDEFHYLDQSIQAKLMKAFQTDKKNNFKIRPVGSSDEITVKNVKLVFATNRTIGELHEILLPDFYDRIVQYVVEIPPVMDTLEDLENDWKVIFKRLYPKEGVDAPTDSQIMYWLKSLALKGNLKGNFRDLENIAKDYKIFGEFGPNEQKEICSEMDIPVPSTSFEYAKKCFELYHSNPAVGNTIETKIPEGKTDAKSIENAFHQELRKWAEEKYGSRKEAARKLGVSEKTLDNWKKA